MKRFLKTLTLALASLAAAATAAAEVPKRYRMVDIMDNHGFETPMVAASMLVPADWNAQGGIDWMAGRKAGKSGPINTFNITSPDGLSSFGYLPPMCIGQSNLPGFNIQQYGCMNGRANSASEALKQILTVFENPEILNVQRDPQISRMLAQTNYVQQGDPYMSMRSDMIIAEVAYSFQGRRYRGKIMMMTVHTTMKSGHSMYVPGFPPTETHMTEIGFSLAYGAPVEDYDPGLFTFLTSNYRENVQWSMRMAEHYARINKINADAARERARITAKANEDMRRQQQESWNRQQQSRDNSNADFNDAIAGIWDYTTSDGSIISVPEHAGDLVELPDGSFVITDIPAVKLEGTVLDWAPGRNFRD